MITLKVEKINSEFNQKFYDDCISQIDIHTLSCSCNSHDNVIHGYYQRKVRTDKGNIMLRVIRVRCKNCGKTHAVLISLIIPYKSVGLKTSIRIIRRENIKSLMIDNNEIDEQVIYRIRKVFIGWTNYLLTKSSSKMAVGVNVRDFCVFLQAHYPGANGFSAQNIWCMKQLYETYRNNEKRSTLVRESTLMSNPLIMTGCIDKIVRIEISGCSVTLCEFVGIYRLYSNLNQLYVFKKNISKVIVKFIDIINILTTQC